MNMNTLLWLIVHIYMHVCDCICVMCFFKSCVRICYLFILHIGALLLKIPTTMFQTYRKGTTYLALWLWFYWGKWLTHIWGDGWARHSYLIQVSGSKGFALNIQKYLENQRFPGRKMIYQMAFPDFFFYVYRRQQEATDVESFGLWLRGVAVLWHRASSGFGFLPWPWYL